MIQAKKREQDERKTQFKGMKCTSKPTMMEFSVTLKDRELDNNYFDQSQKIIREQKLMMLHVKLDYTDTSLFSFSRIWQRFSRS